ncbi:MAG: YggT family protein [Bifidobacteriaceae bacterium]|jgi:YggT family protein|nr:YggT family protein [Bifidobacteriaceae bacterium]
MALAATIVWALAQLYLLVLLARMVLSLAMVFARDWRPRGRVAAAAEIIFTVTDPPIRACRRILPTVRIGGIGLDLGFLVVVIAVSAVSYFATWLI